MILVFLSIIYTGDNMSEIIIRSKCTLKNLFKSSGFILKISAAMLIFCVISDNLLGFCQAFTLCSVCLVLLYTVYENDTSILGIKISADMLCGLTTGIFAVLICMVICSFTGNPMIIFNLKNLIKGLIILFGFDMIFTKLCAKTRKLLTAALFFYISVLSSTLML